jgi:hypothetical protein
VAAGRRKPAPVTQRLGGPHLKMDVEALTELWLVRDYLPELADR